VTTLAGVADCADWAAHEEKYIGDEGHPPGHDYDGIKDNQAGDSRAA
jgi:hypothetical protein